MSSSMLNQYQNTQHSRVMNLKYKTKYKKLKRQIKQMVFVSISPDIVNQMYPEKKNLF